jgi:NADPH:quinone reductase-like Zn-dependent oxidoreductase
MSRYVVATAYGGPEVLALSDEEVGPPRPDEVVVAVRAAGVNPADVKSYSGAFGTDRAQLPKRLGLEAAGVVVEVGEAARRVSVGDEVVAYRISGGYAERLRVPTAALVPKPANLDWAEAAGLMLTGATAFHALTVAGVGQGDTVVVHGGSGGVGLMAVQLAKISGARVIATAGGTRHDFLRGLGAEPVVYGRGLAGRIRELAPHGVDAATDLVGTDEAIDVSLELVANRHRIVTIAGFERGAQAGINVLGGGPGADPGTDIRNAARPELADLASQGRLRVFVAARYPLDQVAEAHRQIMTGHTSGKIVLET